MARFILQARIVTMGPGGLLDDGCVFIDGPRIRAVQATQAEPPAGFETAPRLVLPDCDVLPGLMDLHNHAPYNVLEPWSVPQRFEGRSGWLAHAEYRRRIGGPSGRLALKSAAVQRALARYVEIRALLGGATCLQGLSSNDDAQPYRGLVRNVELATPERGLPGAGVKVMDLQTGGVGAFRHQLQQPRPLFFHLAEGADPKARGQVALVREHGLLHRNLVCIHCLGLTPADHQALRAAGSHVVWSPLSNLMLYGRTLDTAMLAASASPFALGCDWTPTGSRNLLQELKVAWLADLQMPPGFRLGAERLARAVTVDGATVAQCGRHLGALAEGAWADLLVLRRRQPDAYLNLVAATEREVQAVFVDGQALYGDRALMHRLHGAHAQLEPLVVGGQPKALHLPDGPGLAASTELLRAELANLASPGPAAPLGLAGMDAMGTRFRLRFDMEDGEAMVQNMGFAEPLNSVALAPLTVVDDLQVLDAIDAIDHVPVWLKGSALRDFYRP